MFSIRSVWVWAFGVVTGSVAAAQDAGGAVQETPEVITLWMMMESGGPILWVIGGLSVVTVIMALYLLLTITVGREAPRGVADRAQRALEDGDLMRAYDVIEGRDDFFSRVLRAGLKMSKHGREIIHDAMVSEGQRRATSLWQRISYLNNIGMIAPLLGLLGTVWGMIQAFGSIALDDSQVRGLRMAESVAQAMITTAAGLVLAIPAFVIYFYLRGQVVKITSEVESEATEMVDLIAKGAEK